ncbi:reverse transcriptase-like protein [Novosphingobium sp. KACC 22771]|uniref:reverse transcriptase-like protein n=1 Tax=Novosphingobium sp. KACC 22771 TaxID=3025670 RepID=UPI002365ABCF|nr:reverse transcriptase-like protein [Novosphingobium sp. KACC 22771]WDF73672.1 reverse transcriptase-like protein [Novosphingobium sp. KACC 22771]
MTHRRIKIFFDGGCRPNPGPIEAAVVIRGKVHWFDLGHGNNQDAEWLALIEAVKLSQELGLEHVELIGDAMEVVDHANRAMRDGAGEEGHAATFAALLKSGSPARIRWIKRQQNLAGIALASRHPR